ncbi:dienelactone hydrolase family protein [Arthrobacter sp. NamB2]|uniref:dienelactone hydrolase family protein n=1 Tax=Arthrobacter sp. NamB2 TaxID=2576035 RepID=UPI0010CA0A73|nr:dienelactone hydrolase family protein [Arthrobacter sp. NamB2]TKV26378.1 dienelactone hydrolase family protein [Arthrobacter sp. NamB2]
MSPTQHIPTDSGTLAAYVARPEGPVRGGLVLIHEVWGLVGHTRDVADRFAREGYVVVAPDLLADRGITEESTAGIGEDLAGPDAEARNRAQPKLRALLAPLQDAEFGATTTERVRSCFEYLYDDADVAGRVAVTGFCFGGTYSFSLAVHEPRLLACVPFYGHADFPIEELSRIKAPVLAFYGQDDDALVTALPELEAAMARAGVDFTAKVYPGAGHAFFNDSNRYAYRPGPAGDAWQRTLAFLALHVA